MRPLVLAGLVLAGAVATTAVMAYLDYTGTGNAAVFSPASMVRGLIVLVAIGTVSFFVWRATMRDQNLRHPVLVFVGLFVVLGAVQSFVPLGRLLFGERSGDVSDGASNVLVRILIYGAIGLVAGLSLRQLKQK